MFHDKAKRTQQGDLLLKCMTRSLQQESFVFYKIISQKNVSNEEFLSGDRAHSQCTSSVTSGKYDESVLGN